jgi:hypothetical protein
MALVGRYVILFRVIAEVVRVEQVVYGSRDLADLFSVVWGRRLESLRQYKSR